MTKIFILAKKFNFDIHLWSNFWSTSRFLIKFLNKISNFEQNFNFRENFDFEKKFHQNVDFLPKFLYCPKFRFLFDNFGIATGHSLPLFLSWFLKSFCSVLKCSFVFVLTDFFSILLKSFWTGWTSVGFGFPSFVFTFVESFWRKSPVSSSVNNFRKILLKNWIQKLQQKNQKKFFSKEKPARKYKKSKNQKNSKIFQKKISKIG